MGLRHSGNPKTRRKIDVGHGWVAQLAEQWTENPRVGGSIPPPAIPVFIRKSLARSLVMPFFGSDEITGARTRIAIEYFLFR
jgi:hypothetical protein